MSGREADDLTPRERAAVSAGFPADITFGEIREELTRAWAIVDRQTAELVPLDAAYTLLISAQPALYRAFMHSPNGTTAHLNAILHDRVVDWLIEYGDAHDRPDARTLPRAAKP